MDTISGYIRGMVNKNTLTAGELLQLNLTDKRTELVRGRLVMREPAGARHGAVANRLAYRLTAHAEACSLGRVYAAETGFKIGSDPDTVRAPDVAFVSAEKLSGPDPVGFPEFAPDLAVEVLSPDDRPGEVRAKIADWLSAGSRLVWAVDPERRVARAYRSDGSESLLSRRDSLAGEDVLPGFLCPLQELW